MAALSTGKSKPVILLAEDDETVNRLVSRVLADVGEVVSCRDGQEAYDYLKSADKPKPNLIITDVMMPRLDGFGLVAKVKAEPALAAIPMIMLTAKGTPKDVISGINSGVRQYITKPFQQADLLAKVKKILG